VQLLRSAFHQIVSARFDADVNYVVPQYTDAAEAYGKYFNVVLADTPELMRQVYRLRYQVYCVERQFESPVHHERETDEYDSHSIHVALIHRFSGEVCGCARVIVSVGDGDSSLPISRLISNSGLAALARLPQVGEVSRWAVSKAFRRRSGECECPDVNSRLDPGGQRRVLPHITLGLMLGVAMVSKSYGISHLSAVVSPALLRILGSFGMDFLALGPVIDYHGKRQPCIAAVADLLHGVARKNPGYYQFIHSGLRAVHAPLSLVYLSTHLSAPAITPNEPIVMT
jgi:N-acyl amino acid synthase of PEP-CTERM/exosortase system